MQKELLKNGIKGFLVSVITSVLLLLLFGLVCYTRENPLAFFKPLGLIALYLSSLVGGFFASRFAKSNNVLASVISGGIFAIFTLVLSFFVRSESENIGIIGWLMYLAVALIGAFGGIIVRKPTRRKKKHRKRR